MTGRAGAAPNDRSATPGCWASVAASVLPSSRVRSCPVSTDVGWYVLNWSRGSALTETTSSKCSSGSTSRLMIVSGAATVNSWCRAEKPWASTERW